MVFTGAPAGCASRDCPRVAFRPVLQKMQTRIIELLPGTRRCQATYSTLKHQSGSIRIINTIDYPDLTSKVRAAPERANTANHPCEPSTTGYRGMSQKAPLMRGYCVSKEKLDQASMPSAFGRSAIDGMIASGLIVVRLMKSKSYLPVLTRTVLIPRRCAP